MSLTNTAFRDYQLCYKVHLKGRTCPRADMGEGEWTYLSDLISVLKQLLNTQSKYREEATNLLIILCMLNETVCMHHLPGLLIDLRMREDERKEDDFNI